MKQLNDAEYKKQYMNTLATQLNNNKNIGAHIKNKTVKPKPVINYSNNTKGDKIYRDRYLKYLDFQIDLNMKKDKSAEDVIMGIIPPIEDNRTTEQKTADFLSQKSTAMKNSQLLFKDNEQSSQFIDWLLRDMDMIIFFNSSFIDIAKQFQTTKIITAHRVEIYLERLYQQQKKTGGLDDPVQRSDFFGVTPHDYDNGGLFLAPDAPDDQSTAYSNSGYESALSQPLSQQQYDEPVDNQHELTSFPGHSVHTPGNSLYSDDSTLYSGDDTQSRASLEQDLHNFTNDPNLQQEHIDQLPSQQAVGEEQLPDDYGDINTGMENLDLNAGMAEMEAEFKVAYDAIPYYFSAGNVRTCQKKRDFRNDESFVVGAGLALGVYQPEQLTNFVGNEKAVSSEVLKAINQKLKEIKSIHNHIDNEGSEKPNAYAIEEATNLCRILHNIQSELQQPNPNGNPFSAPIELSNDGEQDMQNEFDAHAANKMTTPAATIATAEPIGTYQGLTAREKKLEESRLDLQKIFNDHANQKETGNPEPSEESKRLIAEYKQTVKDRVDKSNAKDKKAGEDLVINQQLDKEASIQNVAIDSFLSSRKEDLRAIKLKMNKTQDQLVQTKHNALIKIQSQNKYNTAEKALSDFEAKYMQDLTKYEAEYNQETRDLLEQNFPSISGHGFKKRKAAKKAKPKKGKGKK
jgi:hypothetical protein